jgi:hypothetical protein
LVIGHHTRTWIVLWLHFISHNFHWFIHIIYITPKYSPWISDHMDPNLEVIESCILVLNCYAHDFKSFVLNLLHPKKYGRINTRNCYKFCNIKLVAWKSIFIITKIPKVMGLKKKIKCGREHKFIERNLKKKWTTWKSQWKGNLQEKANNNCKFNF